MDNKILSQLVNVDFHHRDLMWSLGYDIDTKGSKISNRFFMVVIQQLLIRVYDLESQLKKNGKNVTHK